MPDRGRRSGTWIDEMMFSSYRILQVGPLSSATAPTSRPSSSARATADRSPRRSSASSTRKGCGPWKASASRRTSRSNTTRRLGAREEIRSLKKPSNGCWINSKKIRRRNTSVRLTRIITKETDWVNHRDFGFWICSRLIGQEFIQSGFGDRNGFNSKVNQSKI